jgi:hypothetical protein
LGVDDPVFGVEPVDPPLELGKVPQGEPLGDELGVVFEGCALLGEGPGVAVPLGEVEPGVVCGVAVRAGGVAVWAGDVAVLAGGVAGEPGVEVCPAELCPAELEPPAGAAPPAELCATAQLPQHKTTDNNASFFDMCFKPPVFLNIRA